MPCLENNSSISSPLSQTDPRFSKRFLKGFVSKARGTSDRFTRSSVHCGARHLGSGHREGFALLFTSLRDTLIFESVIHFFDTLVASHTVNSQKGPRNTRLNLPGANSAVSGGPGPAPLPLQKHG